MNAPLQRRVRVQVPGYIDDWTDCSVSIEAIKSFPAAYLTVEIPPAGGPRPVGWIKYVLSITPQGPTASAPLRFDWWIDVPDIGWQLEDSGDAADLWPGSSDAGMWEALLECDLEAILQLFLDIDGHLFRFEC